VNRGLQLFLEQVADDFRVGIRDEYVAESDQFLLQLGVVFDDAVMDDGQPPMAVKMGVGIGVGHNAVGRPTRVTQSGPTAGQTRRRLTDLADVLFHYQLLVLARSDAPRVIAAVLELFQPSQNQLRRLSARANVPKYAAHSGLLLFGRRSRATR
jgi:hypothetical protein